MVLSQHVLEAREYAANAVWHKILAGPVEVGLGRRTGCDEHRSWGPLEQIKSVPLSNAARTRDADATFLSVSGGLLGLWHL